MSFYAALIWYLRSVPHYSLWKHKWIRNIPSRTELVAFNCTAECLSSKDPALECRYPESNRLHCLNRPHPVLPSSGPCLYHRICLSRQDYWYCSEGHACTASFGTSIIKCPSSSPSVAQKQHCARSEHLNHDYIMCPPSPGCHHRAYGFCLVTQWSNYTTQCSASS